MGEFGCVACCGGCAGPDNVPEEVYMLSKMFLNILLQLVTLFLSRNKFNFDKCYTI